MKKIFQKFDESMTWFALAVFVYWIGFVIFAWATFWIKGDVPDTLIQYGLGGGAVELACLAAIKCVTKWTKRDIEEGGQVNAIGFQVTDNYISTEEEEDEE